MLILWKLEASVMPITVMKEKRETGRCQSFHKELQFPSAGKVRKLLLCGLNFIYI